MKYVVTADNHLRYDPPICRTDEDWVDSQRKALADIVRIGNEHNAELIIAGDLTDSPNVHPIMMYIFFQETSKLNNKCHVIGGNHGLKLHREANISNSSVGIIKALNSDKIIYHTCEEENIGGRFEHSFKLNDEVTLVHTLCFPNEDSIPFGAKAVTPEYLAEKYKTPWIFTGDYHGNFHAEVGEQHIVNPGCMTIQSASELDYVPGVYFVDTNTEMCKFIPIYNDPSMLTRNHIEDRQKRDDRIGAFIELVVLGKEVKLSFIDNLKQAMLESKATQEVEYIIDEIKEGK